MKFDYHDVACEASKEGVLTYPCQHTETITHAHILEYVYFRIFTHVQKLCTLGCRVGQQLLDTLYHFVDKPGDSRKSMFLSVDFFTGGVLRWWLCNSTHDSK